MQANNGKPDQTPRSAASDLGLRCLPLPHKRDASLIWVYIKLANELVSFVSFLTEQF